MPTLNQLRGLRASDRTVEEQQTINSLMGYKETPDTLEAIDITPQFMEPVAGEDTASSRTIHQIMKYNQHLDSLYQDELAKRQEEYGTDRTTVNESVNDYIDKIANDVSSYYKRFKGTDKLPISDQEYKELAAEYDARKKVRGEDAANIWLDKQFKNKVGENQGWFEQMVEGIGHLAPTMEGGAIQIFGAVKGALDYIINGPSETQSPDINWFNGLVDAAIDNDITRYGRDVEHAGASNILQGFTNLIGLSDETAAERIAATKASATKYNPEGIGADEIVTTEEQDNSLISAATPGQALYSGGFTALSMLTGAGEAKLAAGAFTGLAKGASWLNSTGKALKTAESLEKALVGLKKAQNFHNLFINPGIVGTTEGLVEGLNTKIEVENDAIRELDDYYRDKVGKEVEQILTDDTLNPMVAVPTDNGGTEYRRLLDANQLYQQIWDKYKDEYAQSREQINMASSLAGVGNFWANSLINGAVNQTFKAGVMAPKVQETLRNSRILGWAYKEPKFNIVDNVATPVKSKWDLAKTMIKEPFGEGAEEYAQSLSNDTFVGAAENNIHEFIDKKFSGDSTVKVGDTFSSDWAAAATALTDALTDKESLQSAVLGAVSSTMGTVGGMQRGYHRDERGNLVRNGIFDIRNFQRGLNAEGEQESWTDYAARVIPWRSGALNAYNDYKKEMRDADKTAAALTEWLSNPDNRTKWDGMQGTMAWMTKMEEAAESNDQFNYRNAQMGKAINDVLMLKKMEGSHVHESLMADLQRAADGDVSQDEIDLIRKNGGDSYNDVSDEEIVDKIKSNANNMLGLMSTVENESKNIDRILGRVDEDTKQSLIFGKAMREDFTKRRDQLGEEIDGLKSKIQNSVSSTVPTGGLNDDIKKLIAEHGSINKAIKAQTALQEQKDKSEKRIAEIEAIDKSKRTDKQKQELNKEKAVLKFLNKELHRYDALYKKDSKGRKTNEVDSDLLHVVLSEKDIMDLDPITRAVMMMQGAAKHYNATHQNQQKIDDLNLQIDDIIDQIATLEAQIDSWTTSDGRIKKGHNKQAIRNNKKIAELQKQKEEKMRALDAEQHKLSTKPIYSTQQQEAIESLADQLLDADEHGEYLNKIIDMGRLEDRINAFRNEYRSILTDPKAFHNYVNQAKQKAKVDLARRRAERVANMTDFQEYSQEIDRLRANSSDEEMRAIFETLRWQDKKAKEYYQAEQEELDESERTEMPQTNYDRYMDNLKKRAEIVKQFAKNPNLTDNDMSLLEDAMEYLQSKGIDVTDRDLAISTLWEADEEGNNGGKFRQWVEKRNQNLPMAQRAYMPYFTSIGQVINDYVDVLNGRKEDEINRRNLNPKFKQADDTSQQASDTSNGSPTPSPSPSPAASPQPTAASQPDNTAAINAAEAGLLAIGGDNPNAQQLNPDGSTPTPEQLAAAQQPAQPQQPVSAPQLEQQQQTGLKEGDKVSFNTLDWEVSKVNPDGSVELKHDKPGSTITAKLDKEEANQIKAQNNPANRTIDIGNSNQVGQLIQNNIENSAISNEAKDFLRQYFGSTNVSDIDALTSDMTETSESLRQKGDAASVEAAGTLDRMAQILSVNKGTSKGKAPSFDPFDDGTQDNPDSNSIWTANIQILQEMYGDIWPVKFYREHDIDMWNRKHTLRPSINNRDFDPIFFITDSKWSAEAMGSMKNYVQQKHMPVVIAVKVEEPENKNTTTAIQVGTQWFQPIGILPSATSYGKGAKKTEEIRKKASGAQGRFLITVDGTPDGEPLITSVDGVNYKRGKHDDDNNTEVHNVVELLLKEVAVANPAAANALGNDFKEDQNYRREMNLFMDSLRWNEKTNSMDYNPDKMRPNPSGESRSFITKKRISETMDAQTGTHTLLERLQGDNQDELITFNSRIYKLYDDVIMRLFADTVRTKDGKWVPNSRQIKVSTASRPLTDEELTEEAHKIEDVLNGFDKGRKGPDGKNPTSGLKGVKGFLYMDPNWKFVVGHPRSLQVVGTAEESKTVFSVNLVNSASGEEIKVTNIEVTANTTPQQKKDKAVSLLRSLLYDAQDNAIREQYKQWQVDRYEVENVNSNDMETKTNARNNMAAIVNDGILEVSATRLKWDLNAISIKAPINAGGKPVYNRSTVANPVNAQPAAPHNVTPQANGAIITNAGQPIEPDSGANLGNGSNNPPASGTSNPREEAAKKLVEKIKADSDMLILSEDEDYYYIENKATGERTKYIRVTTALNAADNIPQMTEEEASARRINLYRWIPTTEDIYNQLKATHPTLRNLTSAELSQYTNSQDMAVDLGITPQEINRAAAELRTKHNEEKYNDWGLPSSLVGNTVDEIVRDFFDGAFYWIGPNLHTRRSTSDANSWKLDEYYPNCTNETIAKFVEQLEQFKADLDSKGITIVSEGIKAFGEVEMVDADGNTKKTLVAGTLDLFGYDKNGNFYIFDMKTVHDHSPKKLEKEKEKWSRQVSMYADLLKQRYGDKGFIIRSENLRIIPIEVDYPGPRGTGPGMSLNGPVYGQRGPQLTMTNKGKTEDFKGANPNMKARTLEGQFSLKYKPFKIDWNSLDSTTQDLATILETQAGNGDNPIVPKSATIRKPEVTVPAGSDPLSYRRSTDQNYQDAASQPAPIIPNGEQKAMPTWDELWSGYSNRNPNDNMKKVFKYLDENEYFMKPVREMSMDELEEDYNEILKDPSLCDEILHGIECWL